MRISRGLAHVAPALCLVAHCAFAAPAAIQDTPEFRQAVEHACLLRVTPSSNTVNVRINFGLGNTRNSDATTAGRGWDSAQVDVRDASSSRLLGSTAVAIRDGASTDTTIACSSLALSNSVSVTFKGPSAQTYSVLRTFERRRFPWEGNTLGLSRTVYPPFTPVHTDRKAVSIVGRRYAMNAFGLWDSVISLDREILAAPIAIRATTAAGDVAFKAEKCRLVKTEPDAAIYQSRAVSDPVVVEANSTIELDGCMRVEMRLSPGAHPAEVRRLWIDIPVKDREAPLMHVVGDYVRACTYAGKAPAGQGMIWDSSKVPQAHASEWQNSFVPYLWLGAQERGIAWFAENDRGWITPKGDKGPLEKIVRDGAVLHIEIPLIAIPAMLNAPREIVFGLQASPTKPRQANWRALAKDIPGGCHVVPWGGLACPYKGPFRDDWALVDRIIADMKSGKDDKQFFIEYQKQHNVPPVYGTVPWENETGQFASTRWHPPHIVYHEELYAAETLPEWRTFQDEWGIKSYTNRIWPDESILFQHNDAMISGDVTYPRSYQDYGVWYANEWLKRDVGLYWDNDFFKVSLNPLTTAAYVAENGKIQPAMTIWNLREYHKRVWQVFQQWRRTYGDDLVWDLHATTTNMLPIQTWGTDQQDIELDVDYQIPADMLQTESLGTQTGNWAGTCWPLGGSRNPVLIEALKTDPNITARVDWGRKMVHELCRRTETGPPKWIMPQQWEKAVQDFGYGSPDVPVFDYWADRPALTTGNDDIKWIAMTRPKEKSVLVVLASWDPKAVAAHVRLDPAALGFVPAGSACDAETRQLTAPAADGSYTFDLAAPYGVRIVRIGP